MHNGSSTEMVNRRNSKGERIPIECSKSIADYNKFMGGVDRFDQYMATYSDLKQKIVFLFYFIASIITSQKSKFYVRDGRRIWSLGNYFPSIFNYLFKYFF